MSEIPSGFRPVDIKLTTEDKLSFAAFLSSTAIPFLKAGKELIQSHSNLFSLSGEESQRLFAATAENLNLPIAAMLIFVSRISEHRDSRVWTRIALAEGLVGTAGEALLSVGSSALGSPEMTAAGVVLKAGSYAAEIGLGAIMHWRLNMDPQSARNNHSPTSPLGVS